MIDYYLLLFKEKISTNYFLNESCFKNFDYTHISILTYSACGTHASLSNLKWFILL